MMERSFAFALKENWHNDARHHTKPASDFKCNLFSRIEFRRNESQTIIWNLNGFDIFERRIFPLHGLEHKLNVIKEKEFRFNPF